MVILTVGNFITIYCQTGNRSIPIWMSFYDYNSIRILNSTANYLTDGLMCCLATRKVHNSVKESLVYFFFSDIITGPPLCPWEPCTLVAPEREEVNSWPSDLLVSNTSKSHQITFIVHITTAQKCLGEWNSWEACSKQCKNQNRLHIDLTYLRLLQKTCPKYTYNIPLSQCTIKDSLSYPTLCTPFTFMYTSKIVGMLSANGL